MDRSPGTSSDLIAPGTTAPPSGPSGTARGGAIRGWLIGLEIALAVLAFGGAVALITFDAGMPASTIERFPFGSALLGGIALLLANVLVPTVVAVGELRHAPWAAVGHLVVGAVLMFWVLVQIGFIGLDSFLQPTLFIWGAVIASLGILNGRDRWPVTAEGD